MHYFSLKIVNFITKNSSILRRHINEKHVNTYNELVIGNEGERFPDKDFPAVDGHAEVLSCQLVTGTEVVDHRCEYTGVVGSLKMLHKTK